MMTTYLVTIGLILILLLAHRHPELGPFRSEDGGCGCCSSKDSCSGGSCSTSHGAE